MKATKYSKSVGADVLPPNRSGKSSDEIVEMMGHSTSQVTEHYLASLDMDKTWGINEGLF
jgi:hypothetical protein